MITGVVTPFHQAIIRLSVRGPTGQAHLLTTVKGRRIAFARFLVYTRMQRVAQHPATCPFS